MKKKLLVAAAVLAGLFLVGIAAIVVLVDPEDIKNRALARARDATGYEITAGPASLKLGFTGAGVRLSDLALASPDSARTLEAGHVDVLVKLLPLLGRRVELSRVVVHEGDYEQRGDWGSVTLNGVDLSGSMTWNEETGGAGAASGRIGGGVFEGESGTWLVPEMDVGAEFAVDAEGTRFTFSEAVMEASGLRGVFSGDYRSVDSVWAGELRGRVDPVAWADLAAFIPPERLEPVKDLEISGTLAVPELAVATDGSGSKTRGTLTLEEFGVRASTAPLGLSGVGGTIDFDPERGRLEDVTGRIGDDPLRVTGTVELGEARSMNLRLDTRIAGATLGRVLPAESGMDLRSGTVAVDLGVRGPVPFEGLPDLDGTLAIDGLAGTYRELPLRDGGGTVRFQGRGVEIEGLGATLGRSDFRLGGSAPDLSDPWFRFTLESSMLDLNELFPEEEKGAEPASGDPPVVIGLPGTGTVRVGTLLVRKLRLDDVRGDARLSREGASLTAIRGKAYGGSVSGDLHLEPASANTWHYEGTISLTEVGVGDLLGGWSDAGKLVTGALSGSLDLSGLAGGGVDPRSALDLDGTLRMKEGTFRNVPVLMTVGRLLDVREVKPESWPFSALNTTLEIRQGKAVLRTLTFRQPSFDWTVEGLVGLDGALGLKGMVRADSSMVYVPALGVMSAYAADEDGRIPIPFTAGGTFKSPEVSFDWDSLLSRVAEKAKRDETRKLEKILEEKIDDPKTLEKIKSIFGKKGGG